MRQNRWESSLPGRLALITLAVTSPLLLACWFIDTVETAWLAALLAVVHPVALTILGACRHGSLGPLRWAMPAALLWFVAVMLALLFLDGSRIAWEGIPVSAIVMLSGLWIVPMVVLCFVHASCFSTFSLTDEDLRRIRRLGRPSTSQPTSAEDT